jgi:hypothetical protein
MSWARNQRTRRYQAGFLLSLFSLPWRWRRYVPPKRQLTFNGLHGVISQKTVLFITTAVRTSNPTFGIVGLRFEVGTFRIRCRITNHNFTTLGVPFPPLTGFCDSGTEHSVSVAAVNLWERGSHFLLLRLFWYEIASWDGPLHKE